MSETNGQGKSRLDRIEEMIERQERANEAAHELFQAEDKRLLTAQIPMNGAMQKMIASLEKTNETVERTTEKTNAALEKMAKGLTTLELSMKKTDVKMRQMAEALEETTGKLNALIDTVDGIIRRGPNLPATS